MSLIDKIFGKKAQKNKEIQNYFKLLTSYSPVFTSYESGIYEMELTRSAIHSFATHCSKLLPEIIGNARSDLKNILKYKPNPYMDTSKFLYRLATILSIQNTAFIVPIEDEFEKIIGFFPILPSRTEVYEDKQKQEWLIYTFSNGQKAAIEFSKVGILTNFQYKNDLFGESNQALFPTLQLLHTQKEGIIEGVKNSAKIRFMAKASNMFGDETLKKMRNSFVQNNLTSANTSGVLIFDNQFADIKQINSEHFVLNAAQQKLIEDNVNTYYGTNKNIMQNTFNEETWNAYYEGKIEPFAIQLSLVMTNMLYSQREVACGNQIIWSANRLQYASNTTKLNVVTQLFDRGFITLNQGLDIFNMPPVENGDERFIRGEYINIKNKESGEINNEE